MAEESGKGIALVILGIVAIIAIVGLVLLFTGARKAAVGEFAVPAAKEYGGAIRGIYDPYSRAFSGRAYEFPSGEALPMSSQSSYDQTGTFSGLGQTPGGEGLQKVADVVTGECYNGVCGTVKTVSQKISYSRNRAQIPSIQMTCEGIVRANEDPSDDTYTQPTSYNRAATTYGGAWSSYCRTIPQILQTLYVVPDYALNDILQAFDGSGVAMCCPSPSLKGTV
ncbi:MAG: hypothetical protein QW165_05535 [Candidatus Woesearchaeota archaeon]